MSRLQARFAKLASAGRKALATFITAGDPEQTATVPALHALVAGGADVLELGIPFSDPEAEGPTIQASSERGLAAGTTLADVLSMVDEFRRDDTATPIVLMGYLNSILAMGADRFAERAAAAGVDGLIMVNLPPEAADELAAPMRAAGLDLILLIAPTTTHERARLILDQASGFVYYVALKGITGSDNLEVASVAENLSWLRAQSDLPVMVGFGIKTPAVAGAVGAHADGVIVGSALVSTMAERVAQPEQIPALLTAQVQAIRAALDA